MEWLWPSGYAVDSKFRYHKPHIPRVVLGESIFPYGLHAD